MDYVLWYFSAMISINKIWFFPAIQMFSACGHGRYFYRFNGTDGEINNSKYKKYVVKVSLKRQEKAKM